MGFYATLRQHTSYAYKSLYQSFACAAFEIWNSLNHTCLFFYFSLIEFQSNVLDSFIGEALSQITITGMTLANHANNLFFQFKQKIAFVFD